MPSHHSLQHSTQKSAVPIRFIFGARRDWIRNITEKLRRGERKISECDEHFHCDFQPARRIIMKKRSAPLRDRSKAGLKNLQSSGSEWYVQISRSTWRPQLWMYTAGIGTTAKIALSSRSSRTWRYATRTTCPSLVCTVNNGNRRINNDILE